MSPRGALKIDTLGLGWIVERMAKELVRAAAAALFVFALVTCVTSLPARAQEDVKVEGEILDMTCYLHKGSTGRRHKACAEMCAEKGLPIGILTESGEAFLLIEDHDNPEPYAEARKLAGKQAAIAGKKFARGGSTGIMVLEAKAP